VRRWSASTRASRASSGRAFISVAFIVATARPTPGRRRGPDPAPAARRDGHVAADQEGEAAEHLLLGGPAARDELADTVGEPRRNTPLAIVPGRRPLHTGCSSASHDTPTGSTRSSLHRDGLGLPGIGRFAITTATTACFCVPERTRTSGTTGGAHRRRAARDADRPLPGQRRRGRRVRGRVGAEPVEPANPYWKQHGTTTIADPTVPRRPRSRPWPDAQRSTLHGATSVAAARSDTRHGRSVTPGSTGGSLRIATMDA
jgi:hypothetical protein